MQKVLGVEVEMETEQQIKRKVQSRIKASIEKRKMRIEEKKKEIEEKERPVKIPTTPEERLALIKERATKRKRLEDAITMDLDDVVVSPKKPTPTTKRSAVPPTVDHHNRGGWQAGQPTIKPTPRRSAVFLKQSASASGRTTKILENPIALREIRRLAIRSIKKPVKTQFTMIIPATSTTKDVVPAPVEVPQQHVIQPSVSALEYTPTPIHQHQPVPAESRPEFPWGPTLTIRPKRHFKKNPMSRYLERGEDGKMYQVVERGGRVTRKESSKKIPSKPKSRLVEETETPTSTT